MKIIFMSEAAALELEPWKSAALVSITEPGRDVPLVRTEQWGDLLRVRFCDAEYSEAMLRRIEASGGFFDADVKGFPSQMTSEIIVQFIDSLSRRVDIQTLYVHCHAGQRRSVAVAKFAAERFQTSLGGRYEGYNRTVYELLHDPARYAAFSRRRAGVGVLALLRGLFSF